MTKLEKKAREIVRHAYFDYKVGRTKYDFRQYYVKMEMLKELFPNTNEEQLETKWNDMFRKEYE